MNGKILSRKMKCKNSVHICFYGCLRLSFFLTFSVNITFIDKEGVRRPIRGKIGDSILYLEVSIHSIHFFTIR